MQPDRTTYIGSSDAAAVAGLSPWKSRYELHFEKTGEMPPSREAEGKPWVEVGSLYESVVGLMFRHYMDGELRGAQAFARHPEHEFIASHVDYRFRENDGVEIKTTSPWQNERLEEMGLGWGEEMTDQVPDMYRCGANHHMLTHGFDRVWIPLLILPARSEFMLALYNAIPTTNYKDYYLSVALREADFRVYCVERDERVLDLHRKMCVKFWQDVHARRPPPADYRHRTMFSYMKRRATGGEDKFAEGAALKLIDGLDEVKSEMRRLKSREDELKSRLLHEMEGAGALLREDGTGYFLAKNKSLRKK